MKISLICLLALHVFVSNPASAAGLGRWERRSTLHVILEALGLRKSPAQRRAEATTKFIPAAEIAEPLAAVVQMPAIAISPPPPPPEPAARPNERIARLEKVISGLVGTYVTESEDSDAPDMAMRVNLDLLTEEPVLIVDFYDRGYIWRAIRTSLRSLVEGNDDMNFKLSFLGVHTDVRFLGNRKSDTHIRMEAFGPNHMSGMYVSIGKEKAFRFGPASNSKNDYVAGMLEFCAESLRDFIRGDYRTPVENPRIFKLADTPPSFQNRIEPASDDLIREQQALQIDEEAQFLGGELSAVAGNYVVTAIPKAEPKDAFHLSLENIEGEQLLIVDHWHEGSITRIYEAPVNLLRPYILADSNVPLNLHLMTDRTPPPNLYGNRQARWSLRLKSFSPNETLNLEVFKDGQAFLQLPNGSTITRVAKANLHGFLDVNFVMQDEVKVDSLRDFLSGAYEEPELADSCATALRGNKKP